MSSKLEEIRSILDGSIELIDDQLSADGALSTITPSSPAALSSEGSVTTLSILDQCNEVCDEYQHPGKPLCRVVHHFACSGGTLISKCIAAMPNVYLLSEPHPNTPKHPPVEPGFLPTDIPALAKYANIPHQDLLAEAIFRSAIKLTARHVSSLGGTLVLRDHSHSDFCLGTAPSAEPALVSVLQTDFDVLSLVTIRNPIDCYLSLRRNGWVEFQPDSFQEYCARMIAFLDAYPTTPIVLYEDFVAQPRKTMRVICELLHINYDHIFEDIFPIFKLTGDSGRGGNRIGPRDRPEIDSALVDEINISTAFHSIAERYYPDDARHFSG